MQNTNNKDPLVRAGLFFLEILRSYLTQILTLLYGIGSIYLHFYYSTFKISIFNYITLNDLVFETLNIFLPFIFGLVFFEMSGWSIIRIFKFTDAQIGTKRILVLSVVSLSFLSIYFEFTGHYLPNWAVLLTAVVSFRVLIFFKSDKKNHLERLNYIIYYCCFLFISVGYLSNNRVYSLIKEKSNVEFSFEENGDNYSSKNGYYKIIGETFDYLFILEDATKEAIIFRKEDIRNFRVSNSKSLEDFVNARDKKIQPRFQ